MKKTDLVTLENVHKLLRIVWVYVENCKWKEKVQQGTLPEELAKELVKDEDLDNIYFEVNLPETEVYAALGKLLSIFNEVYENEGVPGEIRNKFQPPPEWEESNPCRYGNPRFRK